jgi:hypothetical protein
MSVNCFELDIIRGGTLASDPEAPVSPCGPTGPLGPALFIIIVFKIYTFIYFKAVSQLVSNLVLPTFVSIVNVILTIAM